ncbi:hypothetical protein ACQV5M_20925, partial [Leptospira sp. SA-E8]|uniref:hypothetical protein n=1 Tax=Leptospira sp. SA-E8 TaxID=3422259 RepID=UPI003EBAD069
LTAAALLGIAVAARAGEIEDLGAAVSYKPQQPAEAQGITGFDIGVATTQSQMNSGDDVTVTRLNLHKGLPFGIDVGAFFGTAYRGDEDDRLSGFELRYALLQGGVATPAIGLRGAYTSLDNDDLDLATKSLDISISKGFALLTPYAGIGRVWIDSKVDDASVTKTYAGLNIGLGLF